MRVAMIIQGYAPRVGGAERSLQALIPYLREMGVDIHVLTRRYPGLAPFEVINEVPVYRLPIPGPKPTASVSFSMTALPIIKRLSPDIIHAHELLSPTTTAVLAKRLFKIPVVVKILRGGILGDVRRLEQKSFGNMRRNSFCKHVDTFIAISREINEELAGVGVPPDRRIMIPNGVDIERFHPLPASGKKVLRDRLGIAPESTITVFSGRLAPEKRVNHLVSIWPDVRKEIPDAELYILGTGEEEDNLKKLVGDGVHFTGRVENVAPYLQAADLFVLPSIAEGLPNSLLEASASGLPVVATDVGGSNEIITDNETGLSIPPDDSPALKEAIIFLLKNPEQRSQMGQRGRSYIKEKYSLPIVSRQIVSMYENLLSGK